MGLKIARKDDQNTTGGKLLESGCAPTVFADFKKVAQINCPITPHEPWGKPHPPHKNAKTTEGSPTVFAENKPVLRVGSGNTCGHKIVEGSPNVFVP